MFMLKKTSFVRILHLYLIQYYVVHSFKQNYGVQNATKTAIRSNPVLNCRNQQSNNQKWWSSKNYFKSFRAAFFRKF